MLVETNQELAKRIVKPDQWNAIKVICKGPHIQIFVNGQQTVDYTEQDKEIRDYGVIGLQIHSGPATEAWYRNIRVRQL